MKPIFPILGMLLLGSMSTSLSAEQAEAPTIRLEITQPTLETTPYHRPYVAAWLETPERKGITTLALWFGRKEDDDKWLKDLRQWWRKLGRKADAAVIDSYSGATRSPGVHVLEWSGKDQTGNPLPAGEYLLNIEAAREDGGRDYIRQPITLGTAGKVSLDPKPEVGPINVEWR